MCNPHCNSIRRTTPSDTLLLSRVATARVPYQHFKRNSPSERIVVEQSSNEGLRTIHIPTSVAQVQDASKIFDTNKRKRQTGRRIHFHCILVQCYSAIVGEWYIFECIRRSLNASAWCGGHNTKT